jgi:8-oxo-dGTP pyrophosphatase MutT (NUDIX family)
MMDVLIVFQNKSQKWGFPKGHMTRNELYKKEYFKCAKRELFEETGIDLRTLQHTKYGSVIIGNKLFFVIEVKKEFIETNPLDVCEIEKIQWVKRKELNRFVQANDCNVTLNKLF